MSAQLDDLRREYEEKYLTDPVFHAKCKLARRVLDDLDAEGALRGDKSFAAFILMAAQEKAAL